MIVNDEYFVVHRLAHQASILGQSVLVTPRRPGASSTFVEFNGCLEKSSLRSRATDAPERKPAEGDMETANNLDWDAMVRDPRFADLSRRKQRVLWGLMAFSMAYFLLLPLGAAYFQEVFKVRVWGVVNVGLLCALSEFVVVWAVAIVYSRKARQEFDQLADALVTQFAQGPNTREKAA
jgi:uncharacterized membrane protein (DUF485 family)